MHDSNIIRCDREANDGDPASPELRCTNTTHIDNLDGWLHRNYGAFRKTYCPDCAKHHDHEIKCEWYDCDVYYRTFVAGYGTKVSDLLADGWLVGNGDADLLCCPEHAVVGELRNHLMQNSGEMYREKVTARLTELANEDPEVQALLAHANNHGFRALEIELQLGASSPWHPEDSIS